jgi:hypothetical protein
MIYYKLFLTKLFTYRGNMNEERLEELERRLADLEARHRRCFEGLSCDTLSLDCKVTTLQNRLASYDMVVRLVGQSYYVTHPKEAKELLATEDFLNAAAKTKPTDKA